MSTHAATTIHTAATHSHNLGGLITITVVVLVIATLGYLVKCWLFPFTSCHHTSVRNAVRCRRCEGTGRQVRAGRRLINHLRTAHNRANRHH